MMRLIAYMVLLSFIAGCTDSIVDPPTGEPPNDTTEVPEDTTEVPEEPVDIPTDTAGPSIEKEWMTEFPIVPSPERNTFVSVVLRDTSGVTGMRIERTNGEVFTDTLFLDSPEEVVVGRYLPVLSFDDSNYRIVAYDGEGNESSELIGELSLYDRIMPAITVRENEANFEVVVPQMMSNRSFSPYPNIYKGVMVTGFAVSWDENHYYFGIDDPSSPCETSYYRVRHDMHGGLEQIPYDCKYGTVSYLDIDPYGRYLVGRAQSEYISDTGHPRKIVITVRIDTKTGESVSLTEPYCEDGICFMGGSFAFDYATGKLYIARAFNSKGIFNGHDSQMIGEVDISTGDFVGQTHVVSPSSMVGIEAAHDGKLVVHFFKNDPNVLGYFSMATGEIHGPYHNDLSQSSPRFSHNGKWMVTESWQPDSRNTIIIHSLADGKVSMHNAYAAVVRTPVMISYRE